MSLIPATTPTATGATTIIRGGTVVLADRLAENHDVVVVDGKIATIEPTGSCAYTSDCEVIDARGCFVSPGFIDIHSDYVENVASPRPSVVMDLNSALYSVDRSLVMHGITTIFHSLSIYQTQIFDHKPIRHFENVSRLVNLIAAMREREGSGHLIRHRLHMRVELDSVSHKDDVESFLAAGKVDLISFMDHTPGQGQYRDLKVYAETIKSYRGDISDEAIAELAKKQQAADKLSLEEISRLSELARERGISVASHDDDCMETLEFIWNIGATISEFPISLEVAAQAHELGMLTIAGAPNVLLGYSHSGNLSARESISVGLTDILCSDYYPAAMLKAVFEAHRSCDIALHEAFALVTVNPARAVGVFDELGEIAVGKRADLLVIRDLGVDTQEVLPVVEKVLVDGRPVFETHYPMVERLGFGANDQAVAEGEVPVELAAADTAASIEGSAA